MADVFLSYARADAAAAERIARELAKSGRSVWFDRELPAHRVYSDVIATELELAACVFVLWSKAAAASEWVRSEANRARELQKLVQARLDGVRLPMPFDQIQCADLRGWRRARSHPGWPQILKSVDSLADGDRHTGEVHSPTLSTSRRGMLIGGAAAATLVAGGAVTWMFAWKPRPDARAQLLLQKGLDELQSKDALEIEDPPSETQAIALLTQATRADPSSATAWGALALAYAAQRRAVSLVDRPGIVARSHSAADAALKIDPDEPRALAARLLVQPLYRNWLLAERSDRAALAKHPKHPILVSIMADMLGSVGRWNEAADVARKVDQTNFLIPGADRKLVLNLWSAGRLSEADQALDIAVQHWPQHPQIWRTQVGYLMFSGRPADALRLITDDSSRPPELDPTLLKGMTATAEALAGRGNAANALIANRLYLKRRPAAALQVAQVASALRQIDEAFAILDGYYFGDGNWASVAPAAGDQDRLTNALFQPPMRTLWSDRRFDSLLARIGLREYWRKSGTVPDFRRQ